MADIYNQNTYPQRSSSQYSLSPATNSPMYPGPLVTSHSSHSSHSHSNSPNEEHEDSDSPPKSADASPTESKPPQKTQSTFLTKLYAYVFITFIPSSTDPSAF